MTREKGAVCRRGTAVVAALAMVVLSAALLASAAMVASRGASAVLRGRASLAADSAVRRALARALMTWDPACDSLPAGAAVQRELQVADDDRTAGLPARVTLRTQRLSLSLFAISADVRVGGESVLARRRVNLVVERTRAGGPATPGDSPVPIARWSMSDLY